MLAFCEMRFWLDSVGTDMHRMAGEVFQFYFVWASTACMHTFYFDTRASRTPEDKQAWAGRQRRQQNTMVNDVALAAAYAAGGEPPVAAFGGQGERPRGQGQGRGHLRARRPQGLHYMGEDNGDDYNYREEDLPEVNDLEVAAAAAYATMQHQGAGAKAAATSDTDSSDSEDSDTEESEGVLNAWCAGTGATLHCPSWTPLSHQPLLLPPQTTARGWRWTLRRSASP